MNNHKKDTYLSRFTTWFPSSVWEQNKEALLQPGKNKKPKKIFFLTNIIRQHMSLFIP
jgi:hypothetical protein